MNGLLSATVSLFLGCGGGTFTIALTRTALYNTGSTFRPAGRIFS
jgi:hypothetical protein